MTVVYTRTTCAPCKTVKYWLNKKGIEFREKNIDEPEYAAEFAQFSKVSMVPLVLTPTGQTVQGLNLPLLSKLLMV